MSKGECSQEINILDAMHRDRERAERTCEICGLVYMSPAGAEQCRNRHRDSRNRSGCHNSPIGTPCSFMHIEGHSHDCGCKECYSRWASMHL